MDNQPSVRLELPSSAAAMSAVASAPAAAVAAAVQLFSTPAQRTALDKGRKAPHPPPHPSTLSAACAHVSGLCLDLCVGVWVCGCVGVWVCGCVGVWVCGCVGVWVCGRVGGWPHHVVLCSPASLFPRRRWGFRWPPLGP